MSNANLDPGPKAVRWWHCLFGHHWSKWVHVDVNMILVDEQTGKRSEGIETKQRRECLRCGKTRHARI